MVDRPPPPPPGPGAQQVRRSSRSRLHPALMRPRYPLPNYMLPWRCLWAALASDGLQGRAEPQPLSPTLARRHRRPDALPPAVSQYPYGYDQSAYYASYYGQQAGYYGQQQQQQQYGAWQQQQAPPPPPDQPPLPPGEPPPPPPPSGQQAQQQAQQTQPAQQQQGQQGYGYGYGDYYQQVRDEGGCSPCVDVCI